MSFKLHYLTAQGRAERTSFGFSKAIPLALLFMALLVKTVSSGQNTNEYRSVSSGLWDDRSTWERWNGTTWQTPTANQGPPNSSKNIITVRSSHVVTVDVSTSADQLTIEAGAKVIINNNRAFTIANGAGADMTVNGTLDNSGSVSKSMNVVIFINGEVINRAGDFAVSATGIVIFGANSFYRHLRNGGTIPNGNWHVSSTCEVAGTLAGNIMNLGQAFGNLTWNRVNQTNTQNLPTMGSIYIAGNLTIQNTGTGRLDLNQVFLNVGGNFIQTGGSFFMTEQGGGPNGLDKTITINGDFSLSGGTFNIASKNTAVGGLTIGGDFTQTGGTLTETSTGTGHGDILLKGSTGQTFTATGTLTNSIHFTLDNAAGLVLGSSANLPGNLTLNAGLFQLGAFDLRVDGALTGGAGSKYIQTNGAGRLRRTVSGSLAFPVGNSTYNPATLNNSGASDLFSVRVADQVLSNGSSGSPVTEYVVNRTWFIDEAINGGSVLDITLQWNTGDQLTNFTPDESYIAHYTGSEWVGSGVSDGSALSLTFSGVTSLSPFSIGSQGALPVELVSFTARAQGKKVRLDWRTANEFNNAFFYVERSADGRSFEDIGVLPGAGNSRVPLDYAFIDEAPLADWNYYRLRQKDTDGKFTHSPVQAVRMGAVEPKNDLTVFPNPVSTELNLKAARAVATDDRIEIYTQDGRQVKTWTATDAFSAPLEVADLPAGRYIVRWVTKNGLVTTAFVKQ